MKINEVTQPSEQTLFESLDADNDTGYQTSDLVRIAQAEHSFNWSAPLSGDELDKLMENW
jgi:hypothetical protein